MPCKMSLLKFSSVTKRSVILSAVYNGDHNQHSIYSWQNFHYKCTTTPKESYAVAAAAVGTSTSSASMLIEISSPTATPPVSSAIFQVRPQSLRLILVLAVKAAATRPLAGVVCFARDCTFYVVGCVTPGHATSPTTRACRS